MAAAGQPSSVAATDGSLPQTFASVSAPGYDAHPGSDRDAPGRKPAAPDLSTADRPRSLAAKVLVRQRLAPEACWSGASCRIRPAPAICGRNEFGSPHGQSTDRKRQPAARPVARHWQSTEAQAAHRRQKQNSARGAFFGFAPSARRRGTRAQPAITLFVPRCGERFDGRWWSCLRSGKQCRSGTDLARRGLQPPANISPWRRSR